MARGRGGADAGRAQPERRAVPLLGAALVLLLLWQGLVLLLAPPPFLLPTPLAVARTLVARGDLLLAEAAVTLAEIALGLVLGVGAGVVLGFLAVFSRRLGPFLWPPLLALQALPVFAIAPLLVVWFGFGLLSKAVMAALILFFPVATTFADGLRRTERDLLDATAIAGATRWQLFRDVRVPLALPALLTGLRVAAPLAPLGAVVGEWVGASGGLGFLMLQANARMQTDLVFAALAVLAALSLALRAAVDALASRLVPWAAAA